MTGMMTSYPTTARWPWQCCLGNVIKVSACCVRSSAVLWDNNKNKSNVSFAQSKQQATPASTHQSPRPTAVNAVKAVKAVKAAILGGTPTAPQALCTVSEMRDVLYNASYLLLCMCFDDACALARARLTEHSQ